MRVASPSQGQGWQDHLPHDAGGSPVAVLILSYDGKTGIRTQGTSHPVHTVSNRAHSATLASLQIPRFASGPHLASSYYGLQR